MVIKIGRFLLRRLMLINNPTLNLVVGYSFGIIATIVAYTGLRLKVTGRHLIPRTHPVIYGSTHSSDIDPWIIVAAIRRWPKRFYIAGAIERFCAIPEAKHLFENCLHFLPLNRQAPREGLKLCDQTIKAKKDLLLFPEGGRADNEVPPREFQDGAAFLALRNGCLIQPICIVGAATAMPKGSYRLRWFSKVWVAFGEPIDVVAFQASHQELSHREMIDAITALLHERVSALYEIQIARRREMDNK